MPDHDAADRGREAPQAGRRPVDPGRTPGDGVPPGPAGSEARRPWGVLDPALWERVVVVSPHLDDAVLGAAHLLATCPQAVVVTALAGRPSRYPAEPTPWDAACGFGPGADVVGIRRGEDLNALAVLGATPRWLDFVDWQYHADPAGRPTPEQIAPAIVEVLADVRPSAVFLPFGLFHPDHVLTHRAGMVARSTLREPGRDAAEAGPGRPAWFCYEEQGYRHLPGQLVRRLAGLLADGVWVTPAMVPVVADDDRKRRSVECYRSQLAPLRAEQGLAERLDGRVAEQYWQLTDAPGA